MRSRPPHQSCAALALAAGNAAAQVAADDAVAVDEVVVTAQKRAENLQDVPVSVTALSGQALTDRGVTNVIGLNNLAPGLRVSSGDAAANPKIFIRGVGLSDLNPNSSSAPPEQREGRVEIGATTAPRL